jgi:ABC-type sugar transport system ATPase subunit
MTLGTRVAVMRDGVIEQLAPPLELYQRPANAFVAGFVGVPMMNIFPAPVPGHDRALAGVRPHDILLTAPGEGEGAGRVELVEPLGATTVVHVRVDDAADRVLRVVVAGDAPVVEERVGFRINPARMHLFDELTGRRLDR